MRIEITKIDNLGMVLQVYGLVDGEKRSVTTKSPAMWGDYSDEALTRGIYNLLINKTADLPAPEIEETLRPGDLEPAIDAARIASVAAVYAAYDARDKQAKELGTKAFFIDLPDAEVKDGG